MRGFFIAVEGIDGSGKTTFISRLAEYLNSFPWYSITITHEPTTGPIGNHIYDLLLGKKPMIPPLELQRMYIQDRKEHVDTLIRPLVNQGGSVIADRYWLSTLSHGMLDGRKELFIDLHKSVFGGNLFLPDITFILDLPAETAVARLEVLGKNDHFEKCEKLKKIRSHLLELARDLPPLGYGNMHILDVSKGLKESPELMVQVQEKIGRLLAERHVSSC